MIDNYAGEDICGSFEADMLKAKEEDLRALRMRRTMLRISAVIQLLGLSLIAWFDWRLAIGVFILMWGENIARKNRL